ncbi:MAG: MFS transporter [Actinobacteria bacterium]|nr:MFS transporter [Actinomycetota bacterium]
MPISTRRCRRCSSRSPATRSRWQRSCGPGRRAFTGGLLIYGVGSVITASAPTFGALFLGSSIVEALGAALVVPATMALVAANYEGRDRALAFGIVGGAAGAGAAGGPIIGGRVTTTHTWRVVFAAEVVIVLGILACTKVTADGPRKPVTGHLRPDGDAALPRRVRRNRNRASGVEQLGRGAAARPGLAPSRPAAVEPLEARRAAVRARGRCADGAPLSGPAVMGVLVGSRWSTAPRIRWG